MNFCAGKPKIYLLHNDSEQGAWQKFGNKKRWKMSNLTKIEWFVFKNAPLRNKWKFYFIAEIFTMTHILFKNFIFFMQA